MVSAAMRSDRLRGHLDSLLLAALADGPAHGYEISQRLARTSGGELEINEGSLYPALHRLERGALVHSVWRTQDGRRRRVYELTGSGRRAAGLWRGGLAAVFAAVARGFLGGYI
jgi:PadR family transcriptional regulator PadR